MKTFPISIQRLLLFLIGAMLMSNGFCGGTVSKLTQAELETALAGGGTVTFTTSGTLILTNTIGIAADTVVDASGQSVTLSGDGAVRLVLVKTNVHFQAKEARILSQEVPVREMRTATAC